ncbi:MAG: MBG domain-containing protein, partial [Janthinobacterium lividum]
ITNGIANLGLIDATIVGGRAATGALVGENFAMRISNDYVTGSANAAGAGSSVTGSGNGEYYDALRGVAATGGLVGSTRGPVENSWSDATVIGRVYTGGLVGRNLDDIRTSYSTGPVTGTRFVGGLVGGNQNTAGFQFAVENSYSTSMVSGQESIGGLVGENSGTMRNVYSKSARIGPASGRGGLAGINNLGLWEGAAFWDAQSSTAAQAFGSGTAAAALKGLTSAGMTASLATLGLDASTWLTYQGRTAPLLKNFLRPVSVVINDQLRQTYNGSNAAVPSALRSVLKFSRQGVVDPALAFDPNIFLDAQTSGPAINVGRYAVNLSLWSNQKGYDITGSTLGKTVSLVIYPRNLVLTPKPIQKVYDGSTSAGTEVDASNLVAGHTVRASQSLDRADVTIDSNDLRTLTIGPNPAIFAGTQNVTANYFIQPPRPLRSAATRITPRALTVSANGDTRFAGTTPYSGGNGFTVTGLLPGQGNEVLSGQVRYGGTAQGASREGRYTIEPSGLSARNYAITFVNGELVIRKAVGFSGVAAPLVEAVDDAAADIEHADDEEGMFIDRELVAYPAMGIIGGHASRQPAYSIIDRGVRLPIEAGP